MTPLEESAIEAQAFVANQYPGDGIFSVCTEWIDNEPVIVVRVPKKLPLAQCKHPVYKLIRTNNGRLIKTDVVEQEEFRSYELRPDDFATFAASGYDQIWNRITGGLQIAPDRANWVGTLGGLYLSTFDGNNVYGGLTNAHVTGLHATPGTLMMQPNLSHQRGGFGLVKWVSPFSKTKKNTMDAAIIDCKVNKGWWKNNERWSVLPEQFKIGKLSLRWKKPFIGMKVIKSGRTTGVTRGTCTAINALDSVNYGNGDGVYDFMKMAHFKSDSGQFSSAGDSGSYILEESTMDVVAHLFAGGGTTTIGYEIEEVINLTNGRFREN